MSDEMRPADVAVVVVVGVVVALLVACLLVLPSALFASDHQVYGAATLTAYVVLLAVKT